MICSNHGVFILLLICIGFLVVQPDEVFALTSIGAALRQNRDQDHRWILPRNQRSLKAVTMEEMSTEKKNSTNTNNFDLNQSSKRRVRRGSDPIHNRA
ncbi:hypothetical protein ACFX13_021348 [Malus domestica]|uniref:Uncharacterized protein n=2 Tax=Malus TaxID=3749 RepID=A0A498HEN2_MALDO|nr:hypothetical protein DVH24_007184 [Malus domestica]TQD78249.1 hypothetical protein C1H46_036194 [Malus baccata]